MAEQTQTRAHTITQAQEPIAQAVDRLSKVPMIYQHDCVNAALKNTLNSISTIKDLDEFSLKFAQNIAAQAERFATKKVPPGYVEEGTTDLTDAVKRLKGEVGARQNKDLKEFFNKDLENERFLATVWNSIGPGDYKHFLESSDGRKLLAHREPQPITPENLPTWNKAHQGMSLQRFDEALKPFTPDQQDTICRFALNGMKSRFDQFKNYNESGDFFVNAVEEISKKLQAGIIKEADLKIFPVPEEKSSVQDSVAAVRKNAENPKNTVLTNMHLSMEVWKGLEPEEYHQFQNTKTAARLGAPLYQKNMREQWSTVPGGLPTVSPEDVDKARQELQRKRTGE